MKKGDIVKRTRTIEGHVETKLFEIIWVVGDEASVREVNSSDGGYFIINLKEPDNLGSTWAIDQEGAESFQSTVASMSDEQLRASIDSLRQRRTLPVRKAITKAKEVCPSIPKEELDKVLAKCSPEEADFLKKKLGL